MSEKEPNIILKQEDSENNKRVFTNIASSELIRIELDWLKQGGNEEDALIRIIDEELFNRNEYGKRT